MFVKLTLDTWVNYQFRWLGTLPPALLVEIGHHKVEIYQSLRPDRERDDMLVGSRTFTVEGRHFEAIFAADPQQVDSENDIRPMQVMVVDELQ